jgi:23S rRNA pseudouridine955/2504/2580 synthase
VHLHDQLRAGTTDKRYLVLAAGRVRDLKRRVRIALHKFTTADGERRVVPDPEGQEAETIFHRRTLYEEATLLEAQLLTGRTHQIRVHLQQLGHPIAGDDKYGDFQWNRDLARVGLKRMFLHAARLSVVHPVTAQTLTLESPLPMELSRFLDICTPWTAAST